MADLTELQVAALQAWLDDAKGRVRLGHWTFVAKAEPPRGDPDAFAGQYIHDFSDTAEVKLGSSFWQQSPGERRETLAHELVHDHLYREHGFVDRELKDRLSRAEWKLVRRRLRREREVMIDHLAAVIAPLLPLPDIPDPK